MNINGLIRTYGNYSSGFSYINPIELRDEIIEHAKMFNKDFQEQKQYRVNHLKSNVKGRFEQCLESKLNWIKSFFDITEEDLK